MTTCWNVTQNTDLVEAAAVLGTERRWTAYAIADLEPPFADYSRVDVARCDDAVAALLTLRHPGFTAIVTHGDAEGLAVILASADLPPETHFSIRLHHRAALGDRYAVPSDARLMRRMYLDAGQPLTMPLPDCAVRLDDADVHALHDLYAAYPESAFVPDQLTHGVFYGVRDGDALLAAGGTHVVARQARVAAVGNIYTRPEARGRGYGAVVTAAVVADLSGHGIEEIVLNVAADNQGAARIYERLGFREHCQHLEGYAMLRDAPSDASSKSI